MATIAIIGPGAVGGVIAGWLTQRGGHTLTLCARRAVGEQTVELSSGPVKLAATVLTDPAAA
ncbi:MAG: 2-dehydropantoate 2-reductase N-terminal domain-containing protein, partial [Oleiharenicola lentus]